MKTISPAYIFTGETPKPGENYRAALARMITADPQFARATVNYMWAYFFGVGLVDPPDQFDPLRLDPDNPPPASSGLRSSLPTRGLLNALTSAFIANKYDLQWLMRQIVNSQAYQLSARYDGTWNDAWDTLYARKLVRRLWGEEIHDAVAISSAQIPSYNITTYGTINYAMQFPEPVGIPDGASGNISGFLDSFLRGNRDDQPRERIRLHSSDSESDERFFDSEPHQSHRSRGQPAGLQHQPSEYPAGEQSVPCRLVALPDGAGAVNGPGQPFQSVDAHPGSAESAVVAL